MIDLLRCMGFPAFLLVGSLAFGQTASRPADPQPIVLDSGLKAADVAKRPYIDYARECLDLLTQHGTDRYGRDHLPILVTILDVRTRECPRIPLPLEEDYRAMRRERRGPAGANLYMDQPTLHAMYLLSQVTGDGKYADFANREIACYLDRLVDSKGLIWWGWHRHYDVFTEEMTGHIHNFHEIHFQQAMWPRLWEVNSKATRREIEAIWQWHVADKLTGEVNRHDDGKPGCAFAFTAGEIAHAFAFLYGKTSDPLWLDRARLVAGYYWDRRDPRTNLFATNPRRVERFDGHHFDSSDVGLFCYALLKMYDMTGDPLFRTQAFTYLKAYSKYGWDDQGKHFWASLKLDGSPVREIRAVPGDYAQFQPAGHVDFWQPLAACYDCGPFAVQTYAYAYALTRDKEIGTAARRWVDVLRRAFPPTHCRKDAFYAPYRETFAPLGTYAEYYGRTISFLLHMHALTGDPGCLALARTYADDGVSRLYYKGLFRGHPGKPYYEAIDGVGYLLVALIQLDKVTRGENLDSVGFENR